jgi:hypothetical protein
MSLDGKDALKVYEFSVVEGYEWVRPIDDDDFESFRQFDGTPRFDRWSPVAVRLITEDERGRSFAASDFPWLGQHAPIMRPRAAACIRECVPPEDAELLPLLCAEVELVLLNPLQVVDALDLERSSLVRFPSSGRVMTVKSHVFRADRLSGLSVFRVPDLLRTAVFVTEPVVDAVREAKLEGVAFRLLWES